MESRQHFQGTFTDDLNKIINDQKGNICLKQRTMDFLASVLNIGIGNLAARAERTELRLTSALMNQT